MTSFVLLLAGQGTRLKNETKKQFINIKGKEVFEYSLDKALDSKIIDSVILVIDKNDFFHVASILSKKENSSKAKIIYGGHTRQESVFNALTFLDKEEKRPENLYIHDAARPLFDLNLLEAELELLEKYDAVSPVLPMEDSVCRINSSKDLLNYEERENLCKVQTPQAFKFDIILKAHLKAREKEISSYKDDISLLDPKETRITLVFGNKLNFKLTDNTDLMMLEKLIG